MLQRVHMFHGVHIANELASTQSTRRAVQRSARERERSSLLDLFEQQLVLFTKRVDLVAVQIVRFGHLQIFDANSLNLVVQFGVEIVDGLDLFIEMRVLHEKIFPVRQQTFDNVRDRIG
jgi:hypothetical protein